MILELECTQRMCDLLDRIALAVCEVVHRIDAPLITRAVMRGMQDPIHHGVAEIEIGRGHVDFGTQHPAAVGEFSGPHALEKVQVFFCRTIAVRAVLSRCGQVATGFTMFICGQIANEGLAAFYQLHSPVVELIEIVGGVVFAIGPIPAKPADVFLDGLNVLRLLLDGVGVVKS